MTTDQQTYQYWRQHGRCVTCRAHPVVPDGHARCLACRINFQERTPGMEALWQIGEPALMALATQPPNPLATPGTGPCWLRCCNVVQRTPDAHAVCCVCGEGVA